MKAEERRKPEKRGFSVEIAVFFGAAKKAA